MRAGGLRRLRGLRSADLATLDPRLRVVPLRVSLMKPHLVLFVAAPLILAAGAFAFVSAPPEANKMTAVIIPSFIALFFILLGVVSLVKQAAWVR